MLGFAQLLLFIIGFIELVKGHWYTTCNGLQSIASWLLFVSSMGLISISFMIKKLGRSRSSRWSFYCALILLSQFSICGLIGFIVVTFSSIIIILLPDDYFVKMEDFYITDYTDNEQDDDFD